MPLILAGVAGAAVLGGTTVGCLFATKKPAKPPQVHIDNKVLNEKIFNYMNQNIATTSQNIVTSQNIELRGVSFIGCAKEITQTTDMEAKILQSITSDQALEIQDFIQNTVADSVDQAQTEKNGWLSLEGLSPQKAGQITNIKNDIKNVIKTNVTTEKIQEVVQNIQVNQNVLEANVVIDPCGFNTAKEAGVLPPEAIASKVCQECESEIIKPDGSIERKNCKLPVCPINQSIQLVAIAEQIGNDTTKIVNDSGVLNDLSSYVDQSKLTESQGVGGAVGEAAEGVGSGFSNFFKGLQTPFIISGVVLVIALIAFVLLKPKKIGRGGVEFGR